MNYLPMITLLTGPLLIGAVVAAWATLSALVARRITPYPPRLPLWIAWVVGLSMALGGYVLAAAQIITASQAFASTGAEQASLARSSTALIALLISPVWSLSAVQAALGISLHYMLDDLLGRLRLSAQIHAGLAIGLRLTWLLVALLALLAGLQTAYAQGEGIGLRGGDIITVLEAQPSLLFVLNWMATGAAIAAIILAWWSEKQIAAATPASPPPPPPDRPNGSG